VDEDSNSTKDGTILALLEEIDITGHGWSIVDHWEADRFAIGVGRFGDDEKLVYVSTWQRPVGHYFVELEKSAPEDPLGYVTEFQAEDCDLGQVIAFMEEHLDPSAES
jgi:hypothetical protein